jgi:hypothetical protein
LRIAAAFRDPLASGECERLLAEARSAADFAVEDALSKVTTALDPTLSGEDAEKAKRAMEAALFRRDRADAAVTRLGKRLVELREAEEEAKHRRAYEEAREERDELADELSSLNYAMLAPALADVLKKIVANDRLLKMVNQHVHAGECLLASAEAEARGLGCVWVKDGRPIIRLTESVRLGPWDTSGRNLYDS